MATDPKLRSRITVAAAYALLVDITAIAEPDRGSTEAKESNDAPGASDTRDFESLLAELEAREQKLERELKSIDPQLETARQRLIARGRSYYRLVHAGLLPVGGGFEGLVDHAASVERLRAALIRDMNLERDLKARKVEAAAELKRLKAQKGPLMVQREAMHKARAVMQQADERRAAFEQAFGASQPLEHLAIYGANAPPDAEPPSRFSQMRGRLSLPLEGRTEVQHLDGPDEGGLWLLGSRDAPVRSVYAGRIVFVGQTAHGNTVVIDHGEHYFSVYGNLSQVEVDRDESVPERGRLGWVLRHADRNPALYFEIRRGQRILDAGPWLGL
jgi:septal ring factor EnvC (AmiA/AmiB activator)